MMAAAVTGLFLAVAGSVAADELGRLFTTPAERSMLDEIRYAEPEPAAQPALVEKQIEQIMETQQPAVKEEPPTTDPDLVSVKGMVYRKNGRNTAWVNDTNTNAGDLGSQYIRIKPEEIGREDVQITMPDNTTRVKLKVGQTYVPAENRIIDLVPEPEAGETAIPAKQP